MNRFNRDAVSAILVTQMHENMGLGYDGPPRHLGEDESVFRITALQEELDEYMEASTLVEKYDALLDMLVFLLGTMHRHGFAYNLGFQEVMRCNMSKEVGPQPDGKRGGFKRDLVKPKGWVGPEEALNRILVMQGASSNGS